RPSSTASIISTADSSGWRTSSRHAAPPSSASAASPDFDEMERARATSSVCSLSRLRGRGRWGAASALTLLLALTGNAGAQLVDCLGGQRPTQVAELMFGRNIGRGLGVDAAA